jgi:membrane protein implicated in regulation of membrane protease activity
MSSIFIVSAAIVLISAFVYKHSSEEMAVLAGSIALVSLFLSLIFAPWPLQCLLLILVLLSNKRQLLSSQNTVKGREEKKTQLSQLIYRGVKYEPNPPPADMSKGDFTGKYRGQVWRVHT